MRHSASWMNVWDDRILEVAANDEDGAVSVRELDDNELIRTSDSTISRRCQRLAEHGLLRRISQGGYLITDEGRAYLREEYDAETGTYIGEEGTDDGPTVDADAGEANGV
jgi:predicted transcriptional regulator of viral defense system